MGLTNIYNSLNNITSYDSAYYVFMEYDEFIRTVDEYVNSTAKDIYWKAGHYINPFILVYQSKIDKDNNEAPIGLLTGNHTGKISNYPNLEKITNMDVVFNLDKSENALSIEEQVYNHLLTVEYYSNGIIE
jgi:hypothetical protein